MLRRRILTGMAVALIAVPIGAWRLERSDAGAARLTPGERLAIDGTVSTVPRRFGDGVLFTVDTAAGKFAVRTADASAPVAAGDRVRVRGRAEPVGQWIAGYLRRLGARSWLRARRVVSAGPGRGGPQGVLDTTRNRAGAAIDGSMPESEAALMQGFVLGDDSAVPAATAEDFKRSGLAHLLAVSGQNVVLLLAFASAILIALGVPRRRRWPLLAAAVALYVPVAGGGPSIQRAGVMGLVGLLAASLERPLDRWWALYLAAVATLAWNPLSASDVGWQLSFAAVAGIAVGARPLSSVIRSRLGARVSGARAGFAEGAAITASATLATAPLMAHHFGSVSLAALPANLLALPAVAPAMWTGMAIGLAGQLPGLVLQPLGWLAGALVGYIEWVARALSKPSWALIELPLPGTWMVLAAYVLGASLIVLARGLRRIPAERPATPLTAWVPGRSAGALTLVAVMLVVIGARFGSGSTEPPGLQRPWRFETRILDVGQGDSILLRERGGPAVLVDTGYPGSGAEQRLRELGVDRLDALVLTHADADHAGNLEAVAGAVPIGVVLENGLDRRLTARVRRLGLDSHVTAAGDRLRFDQIRLDVIWPPPGMSGAGGEPNNAGIVIVASWRGFTELLTADAEAESASYPTPDVDVLKVPHHGSADAGLPGLLAHATPELAVVSVGSDNTYGHPTAPSLDAIAAAGIPLMRTDESGEVRIAAGRQAWAVAPDP